MIGPLPDKYLLRMRFAGLQGIESIGRTNGLGL
jgi:hypothetical protein